MRTFNIASSNPLFHFIQPPSVQFIDPSKSISHACAPVALDESTTENNISILEDLFIRQSKRTKEDTIFKDGIIFCCGDQKTVSRMLSVKNHGSLTATLPYDKYDWLLPLPGLWHLKYNYLLMMSTIHKHPGQPVDRTSLQYAIDMWNRSGLMSHETYKDLEELITHCYDAHIAAMLSDFSIENDKKGISVATNQKTHEGNLSKMNNAKWTKIIDYIMRRIHNTEVASKNQIESNEIYFCRHTEVFLLLDYSIRQGDIGLLRRALGECTIIMHAPDARKSKYAAELLRFVRYVDSKATTLAFQNAALANCLDNLRGKPGSFLAKDLVVEFQNNVTRDIKAARQSSTKDVLDLLQEISLNQGNIKDIKTAIETAFGTRGLHSLHPLKPAPTDTLMLAQDFVKRRVKYRSQPEENHFVLYPTGDLYKQGQMALMKRLAEQAHRRSESNNIFCYPDTELDSINVIDAQDPIDAEDPIHISLADLHCL